MIRGPNAAKQRNECHEDQADCYRSVDISLQTNGAPPSFSKPTPGSSAFHPLRTSAGSAERTRLLSEIDLFGELQGVINFDAEVADSAFEFAVTKK